MADVLVMNDGHKIRHTDIAIEGSHAHRQLVAEIAHGRESHAWNAQMFAQRGSSLHVVFVERNDTIQFVCARQMSDGLHNIGKGNLSRKVEGVVQTLPGPVGIPQLLRRHQNHAATLALALTHEFLALLIRGNAEESEPTRVRHGVHSWQVSENTTRPPGLRIKYSGRTDEL